MSNMIRVSCAIVAFTLATAAGAESVECGLEAFNTKLVHKIAITEKQTVASCQAGAKHGGSVAPAGVAVETGLCAAGDWVFVYLPETKTSTATFDGKKGPPRTGTRVELKCKATPA
jgi:hypothetical protein